MGKYWVFSGCQLESTVFVKRLPSLSTKFIYMIRIRIKVKFWTDYKTGLCSYFITLSSLVSFFPSIEKCFDIRPGMSSILLYNSESEGIWTVNDKKKETSLHSWDDLSFTDEVVVGGVDHPSHLQDSDLDQSHRVWNGVVPFGKSGWGFLDLSTIFH